MSKMETDEVYRARLMRSISRASVPDIDIATGARLDTIGSHYALYRMPIRETAMDKYVKLEPAEDAEPITDPCLTAHLHAGFSSGSIVFVAGKPWLTSKGLLEMLTHLGTPPEMVSMVGNRLLTYMSKAHERRLEVNKLRKERNELLSALEALMKNPRPADQSTNDFERRYQRYEGAYDTAGELVDRLNLKD